VLAALVGKAPKENIAIGTRGVARWSTQVKQCFLSWVSKDLEIALNHAAIEMNSACPFSYEVCGSILDVSCDAGSSSVMVYPVVGTGSNSRISLSRDQWRESEESGASHEGAAAYWFEDET
jgi:hypothetical protein